MQKIQIYLWLLLHTAFFYITLEQINILYYSKLTIKWNLLKTYFFLKNSLPSSTYYIHTEPSIISFNYLKFLLYTCAQENYFISFLIFLNYCFTRIIFQFDSIFFWTKSELIFASLCEYKKQPKEMQLEAIQDISIKSNLKIHLIFTSSFYLHAKNAQMMTFYNKGTLARVILFSLFVK